MNEDFLKGIFLFQKLDDRDLVLIRALLKEVTFRDGDVILSEGTAGSSLYVIYQGKVSVSRKFENESFVLTELGPSDFFGEMSLIDDFPTSATVTAAEETRVLKMERDDFKALISENTSLSSKMWEALARSLNMKIRKTDTLVQMYYGLNKALCENKEFRELYTSWNFHS